MSQFDTKIVYIKGEENTVADVLSHFPMPEMLTTAENAARHPYTFCDDDDNGTTLASVILPELCGPWESATHLSSRVRLPQPICITLQIMVDKSFLNSVRTGYAEDTWCRTLPAAAVSWPDLVFQDSLWYVGDRLIIPVWVYCFTFPIYISWICALTLGLLPPPYHMHFPCIYPYSPLDHQNHIHG